MKLLCLNLIIVCTFLACSPQKESSHFESLAVKENVYNPMLMIAAPDYQKSFLPGVVSDYEKIPQRFSQNELGFQTERIIENKPGEDNYHQRVLNKISEISQKLHEESTLLIHYSGHGDTSGKLVFPKKSIPVDDLIKHIESQLKNPIARLILVLDSCFSGKVAQEVKGSSQSIKPQEVLMSNLKQNSLSLQAYQNTSYDSLSLTFDEKKIKQMVLVASSSYNETAGDLDEGGLFSVTLWKNIDQLINQKRNIKMNDFFTNIAKQVQASNPSQTPQFAFFPASVAEELLFFEKNQKNEEENIVQGKQEDILQGNEEDILQGNEEEDFLHEKQEDILHENEEEDIVQGKQEEDLQNHSSLNQDSQNSSIHEEEGPYLKVIEPTVLKKGTMAQSIIISSNLKCSLPKGSVIYYENISSKINGHYMLKLKDSPKGCEHLGLTSIYIFSNHVEK